jgi:hypothetical protein
MKALLYLAGSLVALGCSASTARLGTNIDEQARPVRITGADGLSYDTAVGDSRFVREVLFEETPDAVWAAIPEVFQALDLEVTDADRRSRVMGLDNVRLRRIADTRPSRFLNCGHGVGAPNADSYDVYLTLFSQVMPGTGGGSEVRLQLGAYARDGSVAGTPVACSSTGGLETRFLETLGELLSASAQ